ncbi:hypothetical protein MUB24_21685 [Lederbergia sp. NSJ-179]|uniref:hypothetical protein n=1 Tax=Lederbergia sp. NSJ-179 TaxID=2931402 RepID=UPI001FD16EFC|nr:hypothetical protein [Lederbergia sp. NSJ-179]MCJ7843438.1 hypothetical protein [Lederbergia sp. NSJ-179]
MYYEEEFFLAEDFGRNRRKPRNRALECSCNVAGSERDRQPGCECDLVDAEAERIEKHVYLHVLNEEKSTDCRGNAEEPVGCGCGTEDPVHCGCDGGDHLKPVQSGCNKKNCHCQRLKKLSPQTLVTLIIEGGTAAPITGLAFNNFDPCTCCATFTVVTASAGLTAGSTLVIDCANIQAIIFPAPAAG